MRNLGTMPARHELKYFINPAELMVVRERLRRVMRLDRHCAGGRPYQVRSLYFDDVDDHAYTDKLAGVQNRDKYRIRIYNGRDDVIFLERKRKLGDLIAKSSVRITRRLAEQIISADPRGLNRAENPLLKDLYVTMRTTLLRPAVIVDYDREAYVYPVETVRVTFDTRLRTALKSENLFDPEIATVPAQDRDVEILEVKFDRYLPEHLRCLLAGTEAERSAVSKYVLCRRYEPL